MYNDKYEVNVLINGKPIKEYYHKDKFYIEAKEGSEYTIKIKNHNYKKIMAVLSVDGIEVLKGGIASDADSGYIINPFSSIEIKGYRIDENNIATFKFTDGKTSYATVVEQEFDDAKLEEVKKENIAPARNNGVIGVRIWEEKDTPIIPAWEQPKAKIETKNNLMFYNRTKGTTSDRITLGNPMISGSPNSITGCFYSGMLSTCSGYSAPSMLTYGTSTSSPHVLYNASCRISSDINQFGELEAVTSISNMSAGNGYIPNFELGTTWGTKQEDKAVRVKFVRTDTYIDIAIFYLTRLEMEKLGIDFEKAKKIFVSGFPEAFASKGGNYCKQPNDWRAK